MADITDFTETVVKILKNPKMKFVVKPIFWLLLPLLKIVGQIPFFKVLTISYNIGRLERQEKLQRPVCCDIHGWKKVNILNLKYC